MKPLFILHKQTFRSATNIVEGCARESQVEFLRFLEIAFSSLRELHYQFGLSKRLGYLHEKNYTGCELKLVESEKVLGALIRVRGHETDIY